MNQPIGDEEWQFAVNLANVLLLIDSARTFGLVEKTGPKINIERCEEILSQGAALGYRPAEDDETISRIVSGLVT